MKLIFDNEDAKRAFGRNFHAEHDPEAAIDPILREPIERGDDPIAIKEYIEQIDRRIQIDVDFEKQEFKVGLRQRF